MHERKSKLVLRVSELEEGTAHLVLEEDPQVLGISPDFCVFQGPVTMELDLEKTGTQVDLLANVKVHAVSECSRCLGEAHHLIESSVSVKCTPATETLSEPVCELRSVEIPYSGDEIDLGFIAHDEIVLNIGMKPLCSESCKGLCPKCGVDLNRSECNCDLDDIDPRWEALRRISR
jgi:uncharacterized protein